MGSYLAHNFSDGQFSVPDFPEALAKEDERCAYIYGEIDETGLYVIRRQGDLNAIYGESPEVSAAAASYVSRHFEVIAGWLADDNTLMPSGFWLADVLLMSCLDWAIAYGVALPPALQGYYEFHNTRPAYQRAMKINYPDLFGGDA